MANLLIYSGPEILPSALKSSLKHLARILLPNYTIQPISAAVLVSQPWIANCNVLVIPALKGGSDNDGLAPNIAGIINDFVHGGGKVLCLNTAAKVTNTMDSRKEFAFVDRATGTMLIPVPLSSSALPQKDQKDQTTRRIRSEGLAEPIEGIVEGDIPRFSFNGNDAFGNRLDILAKSLEQDGEQIAALGCRIGNGYITFWAPGLENLAEEDEQEQQPPKRPSSQTPNSNSKPTVPPFPARLLLLRYCLECLGMKLPHPTAGPISRPLPQLLLSTPDKSGIVETVVGSLGMNNLGITATGARAVFQAEQDAFEFHSYEEGLQFLRIRMNEMPPTPYPMPSDSEPSSDNPDSPSDPHTHIVICPSGVVPPVKETPLFNLQKFFEHLRAGRAKEGCRRDVPGFGETMIYGQVVGSTQSMFDRNPRLLASLPSPIPLVSLGSHQLSGRGRGANAWISPTGCLQFSLVLPKVPLTPHSPYATNSSSSLIPPGYVPAAKLVFIQYLFALAVVEACRVDGVLGPELGEKIRIKWPNDIYAYYGNGKAEKIKIGGILVSTSFAPGGKEADLVIGCGLDVLCRPPLFSLLRVSMPTLSSTFKDPCCPPSMEPVISGLTMEGTLAAILSKFEKMWQSFLSSGGDFEPWLGLYQERWLHGDQLVKLTTVEPPMMVRICGITLDHGLLRTLPEPGSGTASGFGNGFGYDPYRYSKRGNTGYIDLQPDGNSFDLMAGLIRVKGT